MENGNLTEYLRRHTAVTLDTDRRLQLVSTLGNQVSIGPDWLMGLAAL